MVRDGHTTGRVDRDKTEQRGGIDDVRPLVWLLVDTVPDDEDGGPWGVVVPYTHRNRKVVVP